MNVEDLRAAERFVAVQPLAATLGGTPITIVNLSTIGAQVEHAVPIRLGSRARLLLRHGEVAIDVPAALTWSRLSKTADASGKYPYRSGLRIDGGNAGYALGLHMLIKSGVLRREPDTLDRKRQRLVERMASKARPGLRPSDYALDISHDQFLLVQHARERLLAAPEDAQKWYQRAKYAITHGATNIEIESIRNREEVLAVWEYLERSIDIPTIARAFERMRASQPED